MVSKQSTYIGRRGAAIAATAITLATVGVAWLAFSGAATATIHLEAEDGQIGGNAAKVDGSGTPPAGQAVRFGGANQGGTFHSFKPVTLTADFNLKGDGKDVDTIAFWEAPSPSDSLMFVTSKGTPLLEVWKYPFSSTADKQPSLKNSCFSTRSNSGTNGVIVDQETDLVYVVVAFSPNVCVFSVPDLAYKKTITSGGDYDEEPNVGLLKLTDGSKRLYVSDNNVIYIHDATSGQKLGQWSPALASVETAWGDNFDQVVYVPDEKGRTGIAAYKPDGSAYTRNGVSKFGAGTLNSDGEGILEYTCPANGQSDNGNGLIVVSDQIDSSSSGNDYEVYDRRSWTHLGTFKLKMPGGGQFVYRTDGIGTTQQASTAYPSGIFAAIQADTSTVGIGWNKIFSAISSQTGKPFGCAA